jgi:Zn-dependent protease
MFRRSGSIRLFQAFGIRIGVDPTWFVFLFLIIIWLSGSFRDVLHSSDAVAYVTTVVTALLFFASMIIHELGHAFAARRQGIAVHRIELFLFGGLTHMSRDTRSPREEFVVAIAGPAGTAAFLLVCVIVDLAIVGPDRLWHAVRLDDAIRITPVLLSLSWLLLMNVVILVFNLVPAFPLDGGRIARAAVWRRTGDKARGTRAAARLGQGFALILGGVGLGWLFAGDTFDGLWLAALALMLGQAARGAIVQTAVSERVEAVTVADIMDVTPVAIPAATPLAEALEQYFLRYGWSWFAVVDEDGRLLGIARQERAQATLDAGEGWLTVGSIVDADTAGSCRVGVDQDLGEVMSSEGLGSLGAVMAVDGDGMLRGVVTVEQVRRALQGALGAAPRP